MIWRIMTIATLILIAVAVFCDACFAQTRGEWFKSLMRPDTGTSCCDISDCKQAIADWRDGQWWALLKGEWTAIPEDKILADKHSIDGEAYVCSAPNRYIFCFIRPDMGS